VIQTEHLTLANAIDDLADSGFIERFGVSDGARHRFEGISDPDDMSTYGAYSDAAVSAFLPSALGSYNHGIPVPVPKDPWHDEGGESGSTP
jgi:hypothetical protein